MRGFILSLSQWLDQIHQGDCLELMQQLPDESVDQVVTSPPYNLLNSTGNGSRCWDGYDGHSDDMPHHAYVEWQRLCLAQMLRLLKPDGAIFYNHMHRVQGGLIVRHDDILQDFPLRQVIIWHRSGGTNFNPGYFLPDYEVVYLIAKPKFRLLDGHTDGSVWRIHQETCSWIPDIPTFPVDLPRRAIRATSAQVVLDPFMGSGTTAVAAVLEGRRYIGFENSARYCEVARERVASIDPDNGTPSMPLPTPPSFDPSDLPARGSARAVFQYIRDAVTSNGWQPTVIKQSTISDSIGVDQRTVERSVKSLKSCAAIRVVNHGRWSSYEIISPPRTVGTDAENPPRTVGTDAENPPRTVGTDAENPPRTVGTDAENPPRTVGTDAENPPRTVGTDAENPPRTVGTDAENPPRTVPTSPLATLGRAPGPGPGSTHGNSEDSENGVNDPGPGPGEPLCPAGHKTSAMWEHKDDRVFWCLVANCSWIGSERLGDIIPPGQTPIKHNDLATAYHEKQYRPRKWARRYHGIQQQAA